MLRQLQPELIAMAAGETVAPRRNIPKAARRFVWRLAIFYGLGSLSIGVIVPSNDVRLLSPKSDAAASPFVIGIQRAGIPVLNHIINAAILTSAWSAGKGPPAIASLPRTTDADDREQGMPLSIRVRGCFIPWQ